MLKDKALNPHAAAEGEGERVGVFLAKPRRHVSNGKLISSWTKGRPTKKTRPTVVPARKPTVKRHLVFSVRSSWATTAMLCPRQEHHCRSRSGQHSDTAKPAEVRSVAPNYAILLNCHIVALMLERSGEISSLGGHRPKWKLLSFGHSTSGCRSAISPRSSWVPTRNP